MRDDGATDQSRRSIVVLAGGLLAGTLDIIYASVFWGIKAGVSPERIFQSVAKGLLGAAAFRGGLATAALGLFLHYLIAISMSFTYFLVALRWEALRKRPLVFGLLYGLLLYGIMNYIVLPISAAGKGSSDALWVGLSIAVHMLLIGLPIAESTRRAFRTES